jgi:hypothetical protein
MRDVTSWLEVEAAAILEELPLVLAEPVAEVEPVPAVLVVVEPC